MADVRDGNCGGGSRMAMIFVWVARISEGVSGVSFSLSKSALGLHSSLVPAVPSSLAKFGHRGVPGKAVAGIEQ